VQTSAGTVTCDKVVNCAGQWARQLGALAGVSVPLQPVQHQYVITEPIDGVTPGLATVRDPDRLTYFKEEVGGLVVGGYETNPKAWGTGDVPDTSSSSCSTTTGTISSSTWARRWRGFRRSRRPASSP
jgi:sarcosine dehydrogenase